MAYWSINGNTTNHRQRYYKELGVTFDNSNDSIYINLTMIVPACLASKVINILCVAIDQNFHQRTSDAVRIYVFKSFRKLIIAS